MDMAIVVLLRDININVVNIDIVSISFIICGHIVSRDNSILSILIMLLLLTLFGDVMTIIIIDIVTQYKNTIRIFEHRDYILKKKKKEEQYLTWDRILILYFYLYIFGVHCFSTLIIYIILSIMTYKCSHIFKLVMILFFILLSNKYIQQSESLFPLICSEINFSCNVLIIKKNGKKECKKHTRHI